MKKRILVIICTASLGFFSCKKEVADSQQPEVIVAKGAVPDVSYPESQTFRLPGNYQNWNVPMAPKVVAAGSDGEYEGFINFSDPNSQFYLVRGTQWNNVTTYNQTGPATFGFNGSFFYVTGGAGIYKVNFSTNSYTWSCTKILSWELNGNAVPNTSAGMANGDDPLSWRITTDLAAGCFVFRANKTNALVFGQKTEYQPGMAIYNGDKINIAKPGNYTIQLFLQSAGNYTYSITKNR
jgi:hypothetical protein